MILSIVILASASDLMTERVIYLENVLRENPVNIQTTSRSTVRDDQRTKTNIQYGFKIAMSEDFLNRLKDLYIKHDALKELNLYIRSNKFVIDGTIYFDLLELDIPFTITGDIKVPEPNNINLDIKEMKVWSEGNLPTDKIISKVVKFIAKETDINKFCDLKYNSVPNSRYETYGRITIVPKQKNITPMLPQLYIVYVRTADNEVIVYGR